MTYEQKIKAMLVEHGLFENQANAVFELVKVDECHKSMQGKWNDRVDDYPESMWLVIWVSVKDVTLRWIDANCPRAWYRPMFVQR